MTDPVNKPSHYTSHPSGVECIQISENLSANLAQAFQYVFRHRDKENPKEDLEKAIWFITREIQRAPADSETQDLLMSRIYCHEPDSLVAETLLSLFRASDETAINISTKELEKSITYLREIIEKLP